MARNWSRPGGRGKVVPSSTEVRRWFLWRGGGGGVVARGGGGGVVVRMGSFCVLSVE